MVTISMRTPRKGVHSLHARYTLPTLGKLSKYMHMHGTFKILLCALHVI